MTGPADNEIWYLNGSSTTQSSIITNSTTSGVYNFGASLSSHTFDGEKWVIKFAQPISTIYYNNGYHSPLPECYKLWLPAINFGTYSNGYCGSSGNPSWPYSHITNTFTVMYGTSEFTGDMSGESGGEVYVTMLNGNTIKIEGWSSTVCLPTGTDILVSLDGETKKVEDLKPGNSIVAYDLVSETNVMTTVKENPNVYHNEKVDMTLENGDILTMSIGHPVLSKDGWKSYNPTVEGDIPRTKLNVGDEILTKDGYKKVVDLQMLLAETPIEMWHLDVADEYDTYYGKTQTGNTWVVSHNY